MFCSNCGAPLDDNAKFCENCGKAEGNEAAVNAPLTSAMNAGYSTVANTPEFLASAKKYHKKARQVAIGVSILLPFIGALGGAIISDGSTVGIVIGAILGIIAIPIMWLCFAKDIDMTKRSSVNIDGTITKIDYFAGSHVGVEEASSKSQDETVVRMIFTDSAGQEHRADFRCDREMYQYYKVGDVVRYHNQIDYLEKYDKSRDSYSVCALCKVKADINAGRCPKCSAPLLK